MPLRENSGNDTPLLVPTKRKIVAFKTDIEDIKKFHFYLIARIRQARSFGQGDEDKILTEVYNEYNKIFRKQLDAGTFEQAGKGPL